MSNFVDEPQTFRERFDALEAVLAMQRKRLESIEDSARFRAQIEDERHKGLLADMNTLKQAVGIIIAGLSGAQVGITVELAEALGLKTSRIAPPSSIIKPS